MKLILQHYLASLRERDELDAVIPDLLSQLGLNVYSKPGRGTRQDGVDVAAVGKLSDDTEKVYLFSIKAGDLTRGDWDGDALQSLRPSLNEILDSYIPTKLPAEHKDKPIVICLCFGGFVKEQVRSLVTNYVKNNTSKQITFEEWNGDKLADLIQEHFLREELLSPECQGVLRKSLALIDEPEVSHRHFVSLVTQLCSVEQPKDKLMAIRQIHLCLWIHFSWSRDANNVESTYLNAEVSLLHSWQIAKEELNKKSKAAQSIKETLNAVIGLYLDISSLFIEKTVFPLTTTPHAISVSVGGPSEVDVNLRLFDLLGRLSMIAIWNYSTLQKMTEDDHEARREVLVQLEKSTLAIVDMVKHNPTLNLPLKDDHAIDLTLALFPLLMRNETEQQIRRWIDEILDRAEFAIRANGKYPSILRSYAELLDHPTRSEDYFQEKTAASILYPMLGLAAQLINNSSLFAKLQTLKEKHLQHCNFQLWFPDESSENLLYTNSDLHGAALSDLDVKQPMQKFSELVFSECDHSNEFLELSAVQAGLWPIVLIACRYYRLPVPVHIFRDIYRETLEEND